MDLQRAACILVMALKPGIRPDRAMREAMQILQHPNRGAIAATNLLASQVIDLCENGYVPKPESIAEVLQGFDLRCGPGLTFAPCGGVPARQVVCVWRRFGGWALVSQEAQTRYIGWLPAEYLKAPADTGRERTGGKPCSGACSGKCSCA